MAHEVVRRVEEVSPLLAATAEETEALRRLTDQGVKLIRQAGVTRLLQPRDFGGHAADPRET
ncbi:hypothetical protein [Streptomyces sp. L-9-10]|uniref:hypothetical protein n=1 Tax=unclassified Streptomyces TaxID=2593676 RepID=UPI00101DA488|nr:hypothetical protein [Streptomyces sp. L-9-10]